MTLLRIILCWFGSVLACTVLKTWVGVTADEASATLAPINLLFKTAGSAILVLAILHLKGQF